MPLIDREGLFRGDRIARLSDEAIKFWPFFFVASNNFGRLEIDYCRFLEGPLRQFKLRPSQEQVVQFFREYYENYLAFLYQVTTPSGCQVWCQWWVKDGSLREYKTAEDKKSPAPPEAQFEEWKMKYRAAKDERDNATIASMLAGCVVPQKPPRAVAAAAAPRPKKAERTEEQASGLYDAPVDILARFEQSAAAIRGKFPTVDDVLLQRLFVMAVEEDPAISDADLLVVIGLATKPKQESQALYLTTLVPALRQWKRRAMAAGRQSGAEARLLLKRQEEETDRLIQEQIARGVDPLEVKV